MRNRNLILASALFIGFILAVSFTSASILVSQLKTSYSLGDEMKVDITLDSLKAGYLDVNINCGNTSMNIYHNVPDAKTVSIKRLLTPEYIENLYGSCSVGATYNGDSGNGPMMEISNELDVTLTSDSLICKAGESTNIRGTVYKQNNELLGLKGDYDGFIEATIGDSNDSMQASGVVKDGKFALTIDVPQTTHGGSKFLKLRVYDKDSSGNIMNMGEVLSQIMITQTPAKISIAIDKTNISAGDKITIVPSLVDFAGDGVNSQILIKLSDADGKSLFEGFVPANTQNIQTLAGGSIPGEYKIIAQKDTLSAEKTFEVSQLKKINMSLDGDILTITNVGNVVYKDMVEIKIGNEKVLKDINLDVGEKVQYQVSAPDGTYELAVKGEQDSFLTSGVALTGNAVSISDVRNKITNIWTNYPVVWIFLVIVLALFVYAYYKKLEHERRFSFLSPNKKFKEHAKKKGGVMIINPQKVDKEIDRVIINGEVRKAEQMTVMNGQKSNAAIIAIKVKNEIGGIAKDDLTSSLEYAYKNKAVSYTAGDYVLLLFTPLITKTGNNEQTAIRAAIDIDNYLKEHNRKYRTNPIIYGIGVNTGEILNNLAGKVLQFTSMGKTINLAKKIAEYSDSEVLLSKYIKEKAGNGLKVDKFAASQTGGLELYTIKRVVNTEESSKFMNEFMKRNDFKDKNQNPMQTQQPKKRPEFILE